MHIALPIKKLMFSCSFALNTQQVKVMRVEEENGNEKEKEEVVEEEEEKEE